MSYMIKLHCQRGDILSMGKSMRVKTFLKKFGPDIYKTFIDFSMIQMKLRLDVLVKSSLYR